MMDYSLKQNFMHVGNLRSQALMLLLTLPFAFISCNKENSGDNDQRGSVIHEVNAREIATGKGSYALVGATLIDGRGGEPLENSCVIVRGDKITDVGRSGETNIPAGADVIDLKGLTLLPGLIDAHYHDEDSDTLTTLYLRNGVTSVRDPGEWIESYDTLRASGKVLPRLFLAGPHLDAYPPAYPMDSYIVNDREEARIAV